MGRLKVPLLACAVVVVALVAVGCGGSGGGDENTLVFGTAADPTALDGALISDGESIRVLYQMTEGLTRAQAGHVRGRFPHSRPTGRRATTGLRGRSTSART